MQSYSLGEFLELLLDPQLILLHSYLKIIKNT